jgi:hypothetical protein
MASSVALFPRMSSCNSNVVGASYSRLTLAKASLLALKARIAPTRGLKAL